MKELIGLSVLYVKGLKYDYDYRRKRIKKKNIEPAYIFFDDGQTYIELEEQDYYTYHDCSSSARILRIFKDKTAYNNLLSGDFLTDANTDL